MSAVTTSTLPQSRSLLSQQRRERRLVEQFGQVTLGLLLIVAAAIYLITPFVAVSWMQLPFLGVFLEPPTDVNLAISAPFFDQEAPAETAHNLQQEDTITSIDGIPVASARELYRVLREHQPGDVVTLKITSNQGVERSASITLTPLPLSDTLILFAIPYGIGLIYLSIGLWVYRKRRNQTVGRVFLMLCTLVAILLGTVFDLWTTHILTRLWTASIPFAGGVCMVFAMVFPNEAPFVSKRPSLRWLPLIPTLLLLAWVQTRLHLPHADIVQAWFYQYYFAGVSIGVFAIALLARAIFAASPSVREQSRVVLAGTLVAFAPFLVWTTQLMTIPVGWLLVAFIFFPVIIAYSIVQYSVLDTGRLLSFTMTYTIMAVIVAAGYALLVSGISLITAAALTDIATHPAMIGLLAFGLALAFQPARRRLQRVIDDLFFRSRGEYQDRLTSFRHELTLASGLSEVTRLLKQQIRETLMPSHTYIFLRDPHTGDFMAAGEGRRPDTDIRFESQSGLVHALSTTRDAIFLELNKPLAPELIEEHARLAVLRTPVLTPLQGQERLAGWVAIGNKRSGEPFTIHDLRFIQALAEQASLAVERAQVIGDLERRVRELDVLSQVSQAVNFSTDPDLLLELIYAQASKLIDTTNFYIIMHNPQLSTLSYAFFVEGDERYEDREGEIWPDNLGLASEIIRTGRPIRTNDYLAACNQRNVQPRDNRHYAWMGVPLNAGVVTLGVMVVASYMQGVTFTDDQLKVFWAIADQAATALDKARLFRETESRARQLATLNEISKELSSTLDLQNLLGRIMRSAVEILNTEAGTLFLIDEKTEELVFRVVEGGAQNLVGTRLPAGTGIVGEAANSGEPVIVNKVSQDGRWFGDLDDATQFRTQSLLAVPLRLQDESIGVLEVMNKLDGSPFDQEDVSLLTTFAAQAAVAIQNARLYEATDAELAARVDELQNLQRIDRELNRTLKLDRVITITLDWALRTTGASAGAIGMINAEGTGVEILAANGYDTEIVEQWKETQLPLDMGIVGRVLREGKPEFVENVQEDPDFSPATSERQTVSQITVPILRANQPIGILFLESHIPGLLTGQDFEFLQRLVEHAAVAIENARLLQEVEEANRSKTEFVSFVAHELKNPMTSIRGYTDLLKSGSVGEISDMQVQFLGTIRSNVDRMTRLVSDLADVARIETGHLRVEKSPISVKAVVDETLRALQGQIEEKNQTLHVEVSEELPLIFADHTRMVQVLTNLVSNAHKYTPDGGEIWVGARVDSITDEETGERREMVHHWIRDTGIGMSEEEMTNLFQKFYRTARSKDMAQGTGLGLNITKSLVEWHGGMVWVESAIGEGTIFHYAIPIHVEEAQAAEQQAAD